jgi:PEGA domain
MPPPVAPRVVQLQIARPQIERLHPNEQPDYRPGNRSNYQRNYRQEYQPNYRPLYRPDYRSYRPYYTFRPRIRLGLGLWIGYPVIYPTYLFPSTPYPYAYTSPYPLTYPYQTGIYPAPGTTVAAAGAAGGLSFDITPAEAGVYVDGYYMGPVAQFTPNQPPLALPPGRHHVEIQEPGFEIIAFDVDILPGQVIPYQGDLLRF